MSLPAPGAAGAMVAVLESRGRFLIAAPAVPARADGRRRPGARAPAGGRSSSSTLAASRAVGAPRRVISCSRGAGGRGRRGAGGAGHARIVRILGRPDVARDLIEG